MSRSTACYYKKATATTFTSESNTITTAIVIMHSSPCLTKCPSVLLHSFCVGAALCDTAAGFQHTVPTWKCPTLIPFDFTATTICQTWMFVQCAESNYNSWEIIEITAVNSGVMGTLSSSLGSIITLETLVLSNNSIFGSIPSTLSALPFLIDLQLA